MSTPIYSFAGQTKIRAVEEYLRKMIESAEYPAGSKLPADQELARQFGVAYMTIRHAMDPLAREGLVVRSRGKGTFVADIARRSPATRTVALIVPSISTMWSVPDVYYLPGIVQAFCAEATRLGYEPAVIGGASADGRDYAGAAVLLAREADFAAVDVIAQSQIPLVTIHPYRGRRVVTRVLVRQADGVAAIVAHLVGLGHKRIAFLGGPEHNLAAAARKEGFRVGMRTAGLPTLERGSEPGDYTDASGHHRATILLESRRPPTSIVSAGDLIAAGAIRAVLEAGLRVPEDVSLTGFGDFYLAHLLQPPLTTARLPLADMGLSAARAIDRLIAGEPRGGVVTLDTELVVRGSTGPLRSISESS